MLNYWANIAASTSLPSVKVTLPTSSVSFHPGGGQCFPGGVAPVLQEEFLLLSQEVIGTADDGAQGGRHLQRDEREDNTPDDERGFLAATGASR